MISPRRRLAFRLGALVAVTVPLAFTACTRPDAAPLAAADAAPAARPSSSAAPAAPAAAPEPDTTLATAVTATIEGKRVTFTHGVAQSTNGFMMNVILYETPVTCSTTFKNTGAQLTFSISRGPENKYFAGEDIPVEVNLFAAGSRSGLGREASVRVATMGRARGDTLTATLHVVPHDSTEAPVDGSIRVPLCQDPPHAPSLPAVAPHEPVAGAFGGAVRPIRTVIANVYDFGDGNVMLANFQFFEDAGVTCAARTKGHDSLNVAVHAVTKQHPNTKRPLPADVTYLTWNPSDAGAPTAPSMWIGWAGWMSLDESPFGAMTVRGSMMLDTGGNPADKYGVRVSGTFVATVCGL